MNHLTSMILKILIILIAFGTVAGLLWEPQLEGRNAHSDPISLYFNDPFLAYIYIGSIPFFMGLYQVFKLLEYIDQNRAISHHSIQALRKLKACALVLIGFIALALGYLALMATGTNEDAAGAIALGLIMIVASGSVATLAGIFQNRIQRGLTIK